MNIASSFIRFIYVWSNCTKKYTLKKQITQEIANKTIPLAVYNMIGKLSAWYRENVSEAADCFACRLISGFGMIGIGAFILAQAKRRRMPLENYTMKGIAAGA